MYIWNVNALINDIKEEKISQKEQLKYVLSYSALMLLSLALLVNSGLESSYSYMDAIHSLVSLLISVIGIYACYLSNQKADDRDFFLRFFLVGLPITIRFIVILTPVTVVVGVLEALFFEGEYSEQASSKRSIYQVVFEGASLSLFYFYYQKKFRLFGM